MRDKAGSRGMKREASRFEGCGEDDSECETNDRRRRREKKEGEKKKRERAKDRRVVVLADDEVALLLSLNTMRGS